MYNYNTISTAINTLNGYDSLGKQLESITDRMIGFPQTYVVDGRLYFPSINKTITPKKVIFNNPATIVFWNDGSKTVSKASKEDTFDKMKGFLTCYYKKISNTSNSQFGKLYDKFNNTNEVVF